MPPDTDHPPVPAASAEAGPVEIPAALGARLEELATDLSAPERRALTALLKLSSLDPELREIAVQPPEAVLEPEERRILDQLVTTPAPTTTGLPPHVALIMKPTRRCNLRCTYCYSWSEAPDQLMSFEVLARATRGALSAPGVRSVELIWHGGEPTLRPLSFYRKALWLQQYFRKPGQKVTNKLQTNGTHLTPEWLDFLSRFRFEVGVSLDGPPHIHDQRRLDTRGRPTSERVREGLRRLEEKGVDWGVVMVVDDRTVDWGAERLLGYLLEIGARSVGLLNVVPDGQSETAPASECCLDFQRYIDFLRQLFRCWWPEHAERLVIRELSDLIAKLEGKPGTYCVFDKNCVGGFFTVEPRGEIAHCDKFQADPSYRFGTVLETELADLSAAPSLRRVREANAAEMDAHRDCRWFPVCRGGCPYDRSVHRRCPTAGGGSCCGWAPLIEELAETVGRNTPRSPCPER